VIIDIDLSREHAAIELVQPEDCRRFHVTVRGGGPEALGIVLPAHGIGRLLPSGDALIEIDAVRRLADGKVTEGWEADFSAMVEYARNKGWLDEKGEAIQAHVESAG
jgi:hypothetical protein